MDILPSEPGSYALHLIVREPIRLVIGRLGEFDFPADNYLYLGSARGPGGLRARLRHHARVAASPNWHLDWLRPHAVLAGCWYSTDGDSLECAWSQALLRLPGAIVPAPGFGAADCRSGCAAHLVAFPDGMDRLLVSGVCANQIIYREFRDLKPFGCHPTLISTARIIGKME